MKKYIIPIIVCTIVLFSITTASAQDQNLNDATQITWRDLIYNEYPNDNISLMNYSEDTVSFSRDYYYI